MSRKEQLAQIIGLLLTAKGHEEYFLKNPIEVPLSFFTWLIHGVQVSPYGELWVMDADCGWYPVRDLEKDGQVIELVYKGVKDIPELKTKEAA